MKKHSKDQRPSPFSFKHLLKGVFWFTVGALLGFFLFTSFAYIVFQHIYNNTVYPGVTIEGVDFGGKTQKEVQQYFSNKNNTIIQTNFVYSYKDSVATISAHNIDAGYDEDLMAQQAVGLGRTQNPSGDIRLILQAYLYGFSIAPNYKVSEEKLKKSLAPLITQYTKAPVDALFTFANGRVTAFQPSQNGQKVDTQELYLITVNSLPHAIKSGTKNVTIALPVKTVEPQIKTESANNLGIRELLATGTSQFVGSIPNRIYNISLAATRLNGVLIAPGEEFSFNRAIGDVSSLTGYKQAYVIQNGRTILGDGGGVCQVSTTFFRALLNAGLPITERHAHAYRVGYYEQDSAPGIDASIYTPNIDLRFRNDTEKHILVQTNIDQNAQRLTFFLYGTKDARVVTLGQPVITSQSQAPEALFQDDPNLPKGTVKQVDFAAAGANVYFTREVTRNGKVILSDKFVSNFRPWQAVFLRGTKE